MKLKERFVNLLDSLDTTISESTETYWEYLIKQYSQKFRAYHNLAHLEELFSYYDVYYERLEQPKTVAFAIFYHDIIYNIWKKDNEAKSAEVAEHVLSELKIEHSFSKKASEIILATKHHQAKTTDEQFMVDFDLAILGQSASVYENYSTNIRKEYSKVPFFLYKSGRKNVLQHFLDKKSIFQTEAFQQHYEAQARLNLSEELKKLS